LDLLISLIGSAASCGLAIIFPPIIEIVTFWPERFERPGFKMMLIKDIIIAAFGIICCLIGTVTAVQQLSDKLGVSDDI